MSRTNVVLMLGLAIAAGACSGDGGTTGAADAGTEDTDARSNPSGPDAAGEPVLCGDGTVPDPLTIAGVVANLVDDEVIEGAVVTARMRAPDEPITSMTTGATGEYAFSFATGHQPWGGYFHVADGDHLETFLYPSRLARNLADVPMPLITSGQRRLLGLLAGKTIDDDDGLIVLFAVDCNNEGAAGVSFSLDSGDEVLYVIGGGTDPDATATDDSGSAVAFNVPAGPVTVTSRSGGVQTVNHLQSVADAVTVAVFVP